MARTINQSFLLGNLGGDAEFRTLASGEELATLRLATSRSLPMPQISHLTTVGWLWHV